MSSSLLDDWAHTRPISLVAGSGVFATTLGQLLGGSLLSIEQCVSATATGEPGQRLDVLDDLKHVLLVVSDEMDPAEALSFHQCLWDLVERLSSHGEEHDLGVVFVLPSFASERFESSLAAGLGLAQLDPETSGHAAWRRNGTFPELQQLLTRVTPADRVALRARLRSDRRRTAIGRLLLALGGVEVETANARSAAQGLARAFRGEEYHLDLFCRSPSHQLGNRLRIWLKEADSEAGPDDAWLQVGRTQVVEWLTMSGQAESA